MRPDSVNGADGNFNLQQYEKMEFSYKDPEALSKQIAGLVEDIDGENGVLTSAKADGDIDSTEKTELEKWQNYLTKKIDEARQKFQDGTIEAYETYQNLYKKFKLLKDEISEALKPKAQQTDASQRPQQTDSEKRNEMVIIWGSDQSNIQKKFNTVMQNLKNGYITPRKAASDIKVLIARYAYLPNNSDNEEMLTSSQQGKLRKLQEKLETMADNELEQAYRDLGANFGKLGAALHDKEKLIASLKRVKDKDPLAPDNVIKDLGMK